VAAGWPADARQLRLDRRAGAELLHRPRGRLRPFLRLGLVHQHEEPIAAYRHQFFQSVLGVGDGIRHRAGFDVATGVEVPFVALHRGFLYGAADVLATWFPDPRGPGWYLTAGASIGIRWDFSRPAGSAGVL
jgi:hypothetical protein